MWTQLLFDDLRTTRRTTLWWMAGLALYVAVSWAFYPVVRDSPDLAQFVERLPEALRQTFGAQDLVSPGGYAWARLFSLLLPITLVIYSIRAGTRAVAGDEEQGRLEVLLAQPITRTELLAARTASLAANLLVLGVGIFTVTALGARLVQADLDGARLLLATAQVILLAWALGAVALALGTATGRPGLASGLAFALTLGAYLIHSLSPQVPALQPWRVVSPFWYAVGQSPFAGPPDARGVGVLLLVGVVAVLLATPAFLRRDIGR
ncbi:ABC transporter permease [Deinococcus sp. Arct2-2]|uniref:ABC transporter permease n=1 Tax=Deinococcus sp. Arct2-2 TaxID=2568653 RepID=UPI0010A50E4D|nr:ABC transporter permease [Deinococcus sp. Arct2-2]THF68348.1 ABC transporter permease [Deinococcus sp. Arct2-2]